MLVSTSGIIAAILNRGFMNNKGSSDSALKKEVLSIGKNSMIYMIGQALSRAVGFFMIPVYTRFIAPANYGAMEIIEILSSILMFTISIGAADVMSRYYYTNRDEEHRKEVVSTVILGFSAVALPILAVFWFGARFLSDIVLDDETYRYILQISFLSTWFGMLCDVGYSYLRMVYRAKLFVIITTLQLIIALSLNIWFVVYLKLNILGIFYSTLISQGLIGVILVVGILSRVGTRCSFPMLKDMISFGIPLVPSRIGLMLGFVSNRFFLRWLGPADPAMALAQIGLFSLGHKFGVIVNRFVNSPFNSFWGPRRMELLLDGMVDSKSTVARVCTYATFCSIFAGLFLSSSIESIIEIMADPAYKGAHAVVPFVALSYIALGLESHFSTGIICCKKTKITAYITFLSLIVIVAWNIYFIPRYGLIGAATSNLAGYFVRLILIYYISQRLYPIPYELKRLATMFTTAIIIYLISQTFDASSPYLNLIGRSLIVMTFPVVLFLFGFFHKGERQMILETIRMGGKIVKI